MKTLNKNGKEAGRKLIKDGQFILIKGHVKQEEITPLNIHASNERPAKKLIQLLTKSHGHCMQKNVIKSLYLNKNGGNVLKKCRMKTMQIMWFQINSHKTANIFSAFM